MKLTPFAKFFITVVIVGVLGYAVWHYKGGDIRKWAGGGQGRHDGGHAARRVAAPTSTRSKNAPPDPERGKGAAGVAGVPLGGGGKLAGRSSSRSTRGPATPRASSPTAGMEPTTASRYKKTYGLDVKFVLLEDPGGQARGVPQGRRRRHVEHGRQLGARGLDPGRAEPEGEVDHHAGLVARRRRHRLARVDQVHRGPEGQEDLAARSSRLRTSSSSTSCPSRDSRRTSGPRSRRTSSSRRTRPPPPRCSRRSRSTPR